MELDGWRRIKLDEFDMKLVDVEQARVYPCKRVYQLGRNTQPEQLLPLRDQVEVAPDVVQYIL
jgi:hypothetical protein